PRALNGRRLPNQFLDPLERGGPRGVIAYIRSDPIPPHATAIARGQRWPSFIVGPIVTTGQSSGHRLGTAMATALCLPTLERVIDARRHFEVLDLSVGNPEGGPTADFLNLPLLQLLRRGLDVDLHGVALDLH